MVMTSSMIYFSIIYLTIGLAYSSRSKIFISYLLRIVPPLLYTELEPISPLYAQNIPDLQSI